MKKFILLFILIFTVQNVTFAVTPIDFIYINGSNNNNSNMKNWFLNGINKFHPTLKKQFEKDEYTKKYFLKDGEYLIQDKPSNLFWGYKSQNDLMFMKERANLLRSISPIIAFFVRK